MSRRKIFWQFLSFGLLFGFSFWIIDALLQTYYFAENLKLMLFEPPETIWDALILNVSVRSWFVRVSFFLASLMGSLFGLNFVNQREKFQEQFQLYIQDAPIGIFIFNQKGQMINANPAACAMVGFSLSELRHTPVEQLNLPSMDSFKAPGSRVLRIETALGTKKEGVSIEVQLDAVKLSTNELLVFCTDISEIRTAVKATEESSTKYHALFAQASDGILIIDSAGKIVEANQEFRELFDYSRGEDSFFFNTEKGAALGLTEGQSTYKQLKEWGFVRFDSKIEKENDQVIYVDVIASTIDLGDYSLIQVLFRDVTEQKHAQESLQNKINEVETMNAVFVGREMKMLELKAEINQLLKEAGREKKYDLAVTE